MKRKCFSFEPTGHHLMPLDIIGGVVFRLYCTSCGRVTAANPDNNTANWDFDNLPLESKLDFMSNPPVIIRKES